MLAVLLLLAMGASLLVAVVLGVLLINANKKKNEQAKKDAQTQDEPPTSVDPPDDDPDQNQTASEGAFQAGDGALNAKGSTGSVVTKAGLKAYQVTFPAGQRGGGSTGVNMTLAPTDFFPSESCRVRFKVFFDDGFPWGKDMPKSGGKVIGFRIGTGDASGGNYSSTGATLRVTWSYDGELWPYLYPQTKGGSAKTWDNMDQSEELQGVSRISAGIHVWRNEQGSWPLRAKAGQWNTVELYCKLNAPGKKDGVLEISVNGQSKRMSSVRYRYDNAKINGLQVHPFFGGGTMDYAPPKQTRAWYADFKFSSS